MTHAEAQRRYRCRERSLRAPLVDCPVWRRTERIDFPFPMVTTAQMIEQYALYFAERAEWATDAAEEPWLLPVDSRQTAAG